MDITIKYLYKRMGGFPNSNETLSKNLARHHILSYPFMLSFSVVTFWYIATCEPGAIIERLESFYRPRLDNRKYVWRKACMDFKAKLIAGDSVDDAMSYMNWLCWAESNLFIGPAGRYRLDDPSQTMDKFPLYMDDRVKNGATRVKKAWDEICKSRLVGAGGDSITLKIVAGGLPNFVEAFVDYICLSQPGKIYRTAYREWAAYPDAVTGKLMPHQFWLDLSQPNDDIKDK
ncbi:MAG: hypothetical protein J1F41_10300, partial [Lachnospiraceae bacterium]|nr:hypothetical protein [Lachnospiraceae bacterium]